MAVDVLVSFFFSSRRRHTRCYRDWSSDVCSSDLNNTPKVLAALARHCTKAIFFPIGLHATYEPDLLKQVAAAGHVVGSHTWCHQNLARTKGSCLINGKRQVVEYNFKDEIEKGISAVS